MDPVDDETFIRDAYRTILQRDVDSSGLDNWLGFLAAGNWRRDLVANLVAGEEFFTLGTEPMYTRLHKARCAWVGTLPPAASLLDIGGSSPTDPNGGLVEMGWTGRPDLLTIVDLPPDDQYHGRPTYSQDDPYGTEWGGQVAYLHAHAEDLAGSDLLGGTRFDAVFMGQVIEHLRPESVPALLGWIRDHLTDDGWFAFDTPNRAVTLLQCGDAFCDPDHTKEYRIGEAVQLLNDAGFRVTSGAGILPCKSAVRDQRWDPRDTYDGPLFDDAPDTGLTLALVAVKA